MTVQLTESTKKDLKRRISGSVRDIVQGRPGSTISGEKVETWLANPSPTNPLSSFQHRAGRAICDRWARGARPQVIPGRDLYYRNLCSEYLGSGVPTQVAGSAPPFAGGQCAGVAYKPTIAARRWSFDGSTDLGIITQETSGATIGPFTRARLGTTNAQGRSQNLLIVRPDGTTQSVELFSWAAFANPVYIVSVERLDGLPDDCGDFPGQYAPATPNPTPDPRPGPVQGPSNFPFPGIDITVNNDGDVVIDYGDGEPPDVIIPGDEEPGGGGGGAAPGDQGEPGETESTGDGDETEGEAPPGEVLVGLKLDLVAAPPFAKVFAPGVYRGGAYIYMGGEGGLDHDFAGSMLIDGQFVSAEKDNYTRWKVVSNSGYNWAVTPYYREVEE